MKNTTVPKNRIENQLEHTFILYTLNKEIENQIEPWLKMLLSYLPSPCAAHMHGLKGICCSTK
jgi:hypothetical protein